MKAITLTIPLEPPTVNHYVKHTRSGRHYITKKAQDWFATVGIIADGVSVSGKSYAVTYRVFQGHGSKGDVDNFAKVLLDSLVKAGVIHSDAAVTELHAYKERDRENPRTEIQVAVLR